MALMLPPSVIKNDIEMNFFFLQMLYPLLEIIYTKKRWKNLENFAFQYHNTFPNTTNQLKLGTDLALQLVITKITSQ